MHTAFALVVAHSVVVDTELDAIGKAEAALYAPDAEPDAIASAAAALG